VPLEPAQSLEGFGVAVVTGGDETGVAEVAELFVPLNTISLRRAHLELNKLPQ
jgi:hypothetical protein